MTVLVAHLNTLRIWLIYGGWPRLFLFFSSIPILWLFWEISCPSLVSGEVNLINTSLAFFAAWYSLSYLQDFTRSDSSWGISGSFYLPTCPALPIGPFMRMAAEFVFFFIVMILIYIPLFLLHPLLREFPGHREFATSVFIYHSIQGTFAITPLVFCIRMGVHGAFLLPAVVRMALPIFFCCAFILFQVTGLFGTLLQSAIIFISQILLLCAIFLLFRQSKNQISNQRLSRYFSKDIIVDLVISIFLGGARYRKARSPKIQIALDHIKIIVIYSIYWLCVYFPLSAIGYYVFIYYLEKPSIHLFFFFLILVLPIQDIRIIKERFFVPASLLPVRQDVIMRRFYVLFSLGIALIWISAILLMTLSKKVNCLSLLPFSIIFAPTMAGIWINRITNRS
ncbi:MAG: hypothetical protein PVI90_10975, partial [Desulfobacteraceae bacterium]